jgi:pimeloyl-ACP methyl ester carboxylesterase
MAEDVVAFAKATGADHPLLCGFSDGAQIALELAMRHPDFAQAIVAAGALYHLSGTYYAQLSAIGLEGPGQVDFEKFGRVAPEWARLLQATHVREGNPEYWKTLLNWISELWYAPLHYTAAELGRVTTPTLIVLGDRDEFIPAEEAFAMYRMIPGSELAVLPNGLHDAPLHAPGAAALLLDFLARHVGG